MSPSLPAHLAQFIRDLPKTETHLHIEGALPYELLQRMDADRFRESPPFWADNFVYASFEEFEKTLLEHALLWFRTAENYHEAARLIFRRLRSENVRYVETSFHLGIVEFTGLPGPVILDAIKSAAPEDMVVRVFTGMLRDHYTPTMAPVIESLADWEDLDGIDLHGVETRPVESWTARVWQRARDAGKETKAHAGEFGGPDNVRQVVEELGVFRVQHGVRASEDPGMLPYLRDRGVVLDICPISNLKLGVVPSLDRHPIAAFLEAEISCTVSTDDPFSFGNTILDEYGALARELGFGPERIAQLARTGFEIGTMPESWRRMQCARIDELLADYLRQNSAASDRVAD